MKMDEKVDENVVVKMDENIINHKSG